MLLNISTDITSEISLNPRVWAILIVLYFISAVIYVEIKKKYRSLPVKEVTAKFIKERYLQGSKGDTFRANEPCCKGKYSFEINGKTYTKWYKFGSKPSAPMEIKLYYRLGIKDVSFVPDTFPTRYRYIGLISFLFIIPLITILISKYLFNISI